MLRLTTPFRALSMLLAFGWLAGSATGADPFPPPPAAAYAAPPAIGVLLPLSGRYKAFGESCLKGVRVAVGALEGRSPVVRTIILDTQSEPARAAQAYQRLAMDPSVVAVLGPMIAAEVDAVQAAARSFELPTLAFSQRPVGVGGPLFRFSLTKEDQAAVLAQYVVGDLGLRRWAMLHPEDSYGNEIAAHFRQAVETLGGRIVADVGYPADKRDLQVEAKRLAAKLGIVDSRVADDRTPPPSPRPLAPPPVDGIFLPEAANRLAMVVSYLDFADITGVQLVGASGWDRPQELLSANVNGGVFVDGFFLYSFRPEVRAFVDAFRDGFQGDPGPVEAYGYDAAALVRDYIAEGATTRERVLGELRRPLLRRGATGDTMIRTGGRIDKTLFLLKVEDGTIRELDVPSAAAARYESSAPAGSQPGAWRAPQFDSRSMGDRGVR